MEIEVGGRPVDVVGRRPLAVLAMLALSAGEPVSADLLAERVWGAGRLPVKPRATLQIYVARLRKVLGDGVIESTPGGYRLSTERAGVDVGRFGALVARDPGVTTAGRRASLGQAIALWRGEPFPEEHSEWLTGSARDRLTEQYVDALEEAADLDQIAGHPGDLLGRLRDQSARHPFRESLWLRLLRALAGSGRQPEAIAEYERFRLRLSEELGVDPAPELRDLHAALLGGGHPALHDPATRPRQIPREAGHFAGRTGELQRLVGAARARPGTSVVISAIDGMAGIGKTALATRAAHLLAEDYPDGQLWLNLHGYTAGQPPLSSGAALDRLLRSLGVAGHLIPGSLDEQTAMWRTRVAGRRLLVVLDNALSSEQVGPILPGTTGSLVIVTSRSRLTGLDDAHVMSLDVLPEPDAVLLFDRLVGDDRTAARRAVAEVVGLCGRLPLAVRVAASRLRHRPAWTVEHLAARLRDEHDRLAVLSTSDVSVPAVLDLSVRQLPPEARTLLALVASSPGRDLDEPAAAALSDLDRTTVEGHLQDLVDANLLGEHAPGRYAMHDLVRAHAAALAPPDQVAPALDRLADHYLRASIRAMELAVPWEQGRAPGAEHLRGPALPALTDRDAAMEWLVTECGNLVEVATRAEGHCLTFSLVLAPFLVLTSRQGEARALHTAALTRAQQEGVPGAESRVRNQLAAVAWRAGRTDEAAEHARRAHELAGSVDDIPAEAQAMRLIADVEFHVGRRAQAERSYRSSIALARSAADPVLQGEAWINLANAVGIDGRHDEARECAQQALAVARPAGDQRVEAMALFVLGHAGLELGDLHEAVALLTEATAVAAQIDYAVARASALTSLGLAYERIGDPPAARRIYQEALDLSHRIGELSTECDTALGLGRLALGDGESDHALEWAHRAMAIADAYIEPSRRADARDLLGDVLHARHEPAAAVECWRSALDLHDNLVDAAGVPVREKIARTGRDDR